MLLMVLFKRLSIKMIEFYVLVSCFDDEYLPIILHYIPQLFFDAQAVIELKKRH